MIEILLCMLLTCEAPAPEPDLPPVREAGSATWYGDGNYHGSIRADGEEFVPEEVGCAHRSIPLGSEIYVCHAGTTDCIVCPVNDRGPYWALDDDGAGYVTLSAGDGEYRDILDLSTGAVEALNNGQPATLEVEVRYDHDAL